MPRQIKIEVPESTKETECHVLPCKIHHNGPASVDKYFDPENGEVYFRGRRLLSESYALPEGYKGLVFKEVPNRPSFDQREEDEEDEEEGLVDVQTLKAIEEFKTITVWGHEQKPSNDDPWMSINEWISLSTLIHTS
ncbi:hypothetical protein TRVA0_017S02256 [Trichomonascus vanleenenianus]|uniref:ribonuclease H2 subunit C family protein n=1 Tax=Trichomonascus vanleenenianus TaxID=2268995 RepID=UPI003ECA6926